MRHGIRWLLFAFVAVGVSTLLVGSAARSEEVRELPDVRLTFPTGLAVCPDGAVWVASTFADALVRVDPSSGASRTVRLPPASHPAGLACDPRGAVWFAASGLGFVGRLDPGTDKAKEFALPSLVGARLPLVPRAVAIDTRREEVWFTVESDGMLGRVKLNAQPIRRQFVVTELRLGDRTVRPHGIAVAADGGVWVAELGADRLTRVDPADGSLTRLDLSPGSRPLEVAAAPDGGVWVTLLGGGGSLLRVDTATLRQRAWPVPGGPSSPAAVTLDPAGRVWVSDLSADRLLRFDPGPERFVSFPLSVPRAGVRALAVDPAGRLWFVGSGSGRLGHLR
jgi:virginiamycin B lyase